MEYSRYKIVKITPKTDAEIKHTEEQGYVYMPYVTVETTNEPSDEYKEFMEQYKKQHEVCPICGCKEHMSTLMGYAIDMDKKEDYKNKNRCECDNCGDIHIAHDRISIQEFNNRNPI